LAPPRTRNSDAIGVYGRTTYRTGIGSSPPDAQPQSVYPKKLGHFRLPRSTTQLHGKPKQNLV